MISVELKKSIYKHAFSGLISEYHEGDMSAENVLKIIMEKHNNLINSGDKKKDGKVTLPNEEEYPYIVPERWVWTKFYFALDVRDGTHDSPRYYNEGIPLITSKNLNKDGSLDYENVKYISVEDAKSIDSRSKVDNDDILYAMIGSIGNPVIVSKEKDFCIKNVALFKNNNKEFINNEFLYYYLDYSQDNMKKESNGGVQQFVSLNYLRNYYLPLPPIEEQNRIVEKIKELFSKMAEVNKLENKLEILKKSISNEMRTSIIDYAIHGSITKQNENDNSIFEDLPSKIKYAENEKKFNLNIDEQEFPFDIPKNWTWVKLGMLFDYQNGYSYKPIETSKSKIGYPVIKSQNIMKRIVEISDKTVYVENPTSQMLKSKIVKGDFLMCLSSQSSNPEPLGKTAIYEEEDFALLNQRVLKLSPYDERFSKYLYYAINSFYFHNTVSHKGGGSAQSNLKLEHVMEMYIPMPPIEEQKRIVDKIEMLLPLCNDIEGLVS